MNNRIIKFRVWDKLNSQFINKDIGGYIINGEDVELNLVYNNKDYVFQQLTELLDKNGKEIYEGDILLLPDEYTEPILDYGQGPTEPCNHISEVIYNENEVAFGVIITDRANFIKIGFNSFSKLLYDMGKFYIKDECEIIGNIFENPELLS